MNMKMRINSFLNINIFYILYLNKKILLSILFNNKFNIIDINLYNKRRKFFIISFLIIIYLLFPFLINFVDKIINKHINF